MKIPYFNCFFSNFYTSAFCEEYYSPLIICILTYVYTHRVQPYLKTILLGTAPISFIDQAIAKIFSLGMNKMGHE